MSWLSTALGGGNVGAEISRDVKGAVSSIGKMSTSQLLRKLKPSEGVIRVVGMIPAIGNTLAGGLQYAREGMQTASTAIDKYGISSTPVSKLSTKKLIEAGRGAVSSGVSSALKPKVPGVTGGGGQVVTPRAVVPTGINPMATAPSLTQPLGGLTHARSTTISPGRGSWWARANISRGGSSGIFGAISAHHR